MKLIIITVVHNASKMLFLTYDSLRSQTYKDFIWIIKDSNSNDNTEEIVNSFRSDINNIIYINKKDLGIYNGMNEAISTSGILNQGILTFLNAGDRYSSDLLLEQLLARYNNNSPVIAIPVQVLGVKYHQKLCENKVLKNICHQSTFYNLDMSEVRENIKFNEKYSLCADFDLLLKLSRFGNINYLSDIPPVIYDSTGVSSTKNKVRLWQKLIITWRSQFSFVIKINTSIIIIKELMKNVFNCNTIVQRK